MDSNDDDFTPVSSFEQTLLTVQECFVYKVPPLRTASGHRAEDWGLDKPVFTGCLKVFQTDKKLKVSVYRFNDPTTVLTTSENLTLFAECHIEVKPKEDVTAFVDGVIDSSRYYVLRIQDPKNPTRSVFLGIGFRERETAFDFKNALNDYVRYVDRMALADQLSHLRVEEGTHPGADHGQGDASQATSASVLASPLAQHRDLSLKQGDKIKVPINIKRHHADPATPASPSSDTGKGFPRGSFLPPPPPPGSVVFASLPPPRPASDAPADDGDWGDFEAPPPVLPATTGAAGSSSASDAVGDLDDWGDFATPDTSSATTA